ncbi:phosphatidylinositol 3,4,5-trisphosphate 5-phosphatase 2-like [Pezoporus wallicus]|uniref:phosphatidylinositol 3,4,5-trisphosphate 5-phosphatase 2-like n=1 Tax=Pezoporus wallicus TaxID=35540 RepID=UPI00254EECBD|nr:phosphatidylinositol 3,4,5-trisphosphate 5-phosphatase 2-like [Pezoporus wallicus]
MSSAAPSTPPQPLSRKAKSIPVQTFEVKLDVTLGDLTKIGEVPEVHLERGRGGGSWWCSRSRRTRRRTGTPSPTTRSGS